MAGNENSGKKAGKSIKKTTIKASDDSVIEIAIPFKERVQLLAELARGVWMEEATPDGGKKIYLTKPDVKALQQLNEMQYNFEFLRKQTKPAGHVVLQTSVNPVGFLFL